MSVIIGPMRGRLQGKLRGDGRYEIRVVTTDEFGGKHTKSVYGRTLVEAQTAAAKVIALERRQATEKHTIAELADVYEDATWPRIADGTKRQYGPAIKRIRKAFEAFRDIREIRHADVSRQLKAWALDPKLGGRSVQVHRNVLGYMFVFGMELDWCESNPTAGVRLPVSATQKNKAPMTPRVYRLLLESETDPVLRDLWELLGETGLRPDREALDLERGAIFYSMDMYWLRVGGSKTEAGEGREIPLPDKLAHRLQEREGLLFPSAVGTRLDYRNVRRAWDKTFKCEALKDAGDFSPYALRKLCVSRWIANGLPDDVVKHFTGHTDIRITKNIYQQIGRDRLMESMFSGTALAELTKE